MNGTPIVRTRLIGRGGNGYVFEYGPFAIKVKCREDCEWEWMRYVARRLRDPLPRHSVGAVHRMVINARDFAPLVDVRPNAHGRVIVYVSELGVSLSRLPHRLNAEDSAQVALQLLMVYANLRSIGVRHGGVGAHHVLLVRNHGRRPVCLRYGDRAIDRGFKWIAYPIDYRRCERATDWREFEELTRLLNGDPHFTGLTVACVDNEQQLRDEIDRLAGGATACSIC